MFGMKFWIKFAPVIIALASLLIVFYKEFLEGHSLHSSIQQIYMLRATGAPNKQFFIEMIRRDLKSKTPSQSVLDLVKKYPELKTIDVKNEKVKEINSAVFDEYEPPLKICKELAKERNLGIPFYIPLVIYNSGRKHAPLNTLILIVKRKDLKSESYIYTVFYEIKSNILLKRDTYFSDQDRISKPYTGYAIGGKESIKIETVFLPWSSSNKKVSKDKVLVPGNYELQVFGFDPKGKVILKTEKADYEIKYDRILKALTGEESGRYPGLEDLINKII